MKAVLVGIKKLDFKTNEGESVKGINLFINHKDTGVTGYSSRKLFISSKDIDEVLGVDLEKCLGKEIELDLGFGGRVVFISAV